jgi:hypothetical protein
VRILKSIPMVVMNDAWKSSSEKRSSKQDFPTPVATKRMQCWESLWYSGCSGAHDVGAPEERTAIADEEELHELVIMRFLTHFPRLYPPPNECLRPPGVTPFKPQAFALRPDP